MQYHVSDTLDLGNLTLNGGWKGMRVVNRANLRTGSLVAGRIQAKDWFLPQIGALYRLGGGAEVFASYTENMRAFVSSATTGPVRDDAERLQRHPRDAEARDVEDGRGRRAPPVRAGCNCRRSAITSISPTAC
ncbi:hypothetical protein AB5I41_08955 [Sphingomonas sp. MMS24-JH45]